MAVLKKEQERDELHRAIWAIADELRGSVDGWDQKGHGIMIYTIDGLRAIVAPIARKYRLRAVYVFGSYARNEATEESDVDLLIDREGSDIRTMFDMGGLYEDLCGRIHKDVDLVTTQSLEQKSSRQRTPVFVETVKSERIRIYE